MLYRTLLAFILTASCASSAPRRQAPATPPPDAPSGGGPAPADAAPTPPPPDAPEDALSAPDLIVPDAPAPPDVPGPSGACKFALCEGFETYKEGDVPDPSLWVQQATKATVGSALAARGTKALHIPAFTKDRVQIRETKTFPALAKAFYARVFLYVDKQPVEAPATLYHWTLIEASEAPDDSGHRVRLGGHIEKAVGPTDWLRFNYETGLPVTTHETGLSDPSSVIEPKKWHCIQVYFNMTTSEARIWLDDVERPKLHWQNNMPGMFSFPAAIQSLSFGWVEYQPPATPWEVWLDEIAVDANPIGCQD